MVYNVMCNVLLDNELRIMHSQSCENEEKMTLAADSFPNPLTPAKTLRNETPQKGKLGALNQKSSVAGGVDPGG